MKTKYIIFVLCLFIVSCESSTESNLQSDFESCLESNNHISANYNYDKIVKYADSLDSDLALKCIFSNDLNYDGSSKSWSYKYSKPIDSTYLCKDYYINSSYNSVSCDSVIVRGMTVGDGYISKNWIDSDIATKIAETNGGKEFRNNNSDYNISASLGEAVVSNANPTWYITYISKSNKDKCFTASINAVTKSVHIYKK
jgi:hypothetical protein